MSLTFSTFFCDSGLSAPPKMVHSVFFCAACGSGERKATAPFWVSSLHSPIHWMIHPHSFAREFMLIPAFVHTSSFHLVVLSYLPSVLRSVYCWFLFQQISILSVHRLIQLIHSSTQRAALATRPLFAWLVCVPLGNGCFNECSWLGLSVLYLSSIHKVSTKYPSSIHQVANFYQFLVPIFLANHMWKLTSSGGCTSLRSVEIPISVTSIGGWAFQDWHWAASITTITMEG